MLGLEVARWLLSRGARRLILAGRTRLPPREGWDRVTDPGLRNRIEVVCALEALGVTVRVLALDISDLRQSRRLLDTNEMGLPPIRGWYTPLECSTTGCCVTWTRSLCAE